jgi:hypothetical protein
MEISQGGPTPPSLEFHAALTLEEFEPERAPAPMLIHMGSAHYELLGQVVHMADDWWAVDVGPLAFREQRPPANLHQGSWVRGDAYLGIDPFFYFERLAHRPGAPALIYDWKIAKIDMQTAALVEVESRVWKYDEARLGWKEIAETNAWNDGGEYLLHCKRLDGPPRRTRGS